MSLESWRRRSLPEDICVSFEVSIEEEYDRGIYSLILRIDAQD